MPTVIEHESKIREKCSNGTLYRNDAKLATWLGVHPEDVDEVLDRLVGSGFLARAGTSSRGSEIFTFTPAEEEAPPTRRASLAMELVTELENRGIQVTRSYPPVDIPALAEAIIDGLVLLEGRKVSCPFDAVYPFALNAFAKTDPIRGNPFAQ